MLVCAYLWLFQVILKILLVWVLPHISFFATLICKFLIVYTSCNMPIFEHKPIPSFSTWLISSPSFVSPPPHSIRFFSLLSSFLVSVYLGGLVISETLCFVLSQDSDLTCRTGETYLCFFGHKLRRWFPSLAYCLYSLWLQVVEFIYFGQCWKEDLGYRCLNHHHYFESTFLTYWI